MLRERDDLIERTGGDGKRSNVGFIRSRSLPECLLRVFFQLRQAEPSPAPFQPNRASDATRVLDAPDLLTYRRTADKLDAPRREFRRWRSARVSLVPSKLAARLSVYALKEG